MMRLNGFANETDRKGKGVIMGSKKDDGESVSGELMRREDGGVPVVRALFATLSRLPFKNFWQRKKISSMKEVISVKSSVSHRRHLRESS